jgi:hypothetical protein
MSVAYMAGKVLLSCLANNAQLARLANSLMERLFKGKRDLTREMQREEDVKVVMPYSHMKSETDVKSELAKTI